MNNAKTIPVGQGVEKKSNGPRSIVYPKSMLDNKTVESELCALERNMGSALRVSPKAAKCRMMDVLCVIGILQGTMDQVHNDYSLRALGLLGKKEAINTLQDYPQDLRKTLEGLKDLALEKEAKAEMREKRLANRLHISGGCDYHDRLPASQRYARIAAEIGGILDRLD